MALTVEAMALANGAWSLQDALDAMVDRALCGSFAPPTEAEVSTILDAVQRLQSVCDAFSKRAA